MKEKIPKRRSMKRILGIQLLIVSVLMLGFGILNMYGQKTIAEQADEAGLKILSLAMSKADEQIAATEKQMAQYMDSEKSTLNKIKRNTIEKQYLYSVLDRRMRAMFSPNEWMGFCCLYDTNENRLISYRVGGDILIDEGRNYIKELLMQAEKVSSHWTVRYMDRKPYFVRAMKVDEYYLFTFLNGEQIFKELGKGGTNPFDEFLYSDAQRMPVTDISLSEDAKEAIHEFQRTLIYDVPSESYRMLGYRSGRSGIGLMGIQYQSLLQKNMGILQIILIVLSVFGGLYVIGWGVFSRRTLIEPVETMVRAMEVAGAGDLSVRLKEEAYYQELVCMNTQFNRMLGEIERLKIHVYEEKISRQNAELKFLQLQINPHFFLNAMNLIYSLALTRQTDRIKDLVACLMRHTRFVLKSRKKRITIKEELEHIGNFMEIQRVRYNYPIIFEVSIKEDMKQESIAPMLLYTFVENSVKYGLASEDKGISVQVRIDREVREGIPGILFQVKDQGNGFSEEILQKLAAGENIVDERGEEHYGIANAVQRLEILYQGKAWICFKNDAGAKVEFWVPMEGA